MVSDFSSPELKPDPREEIHLSGASTTLQFKLLLFLLTVKFISLIQSASKSSCKVIPLQQQEFTTL